MCQQGQTLHARSIAVFCGCFWPWVPSLRPGTEKRVGCAPHRHQALPLTSACSRDRGLRPAHVAAHAASLSQACVHAMSLLCACACAPWCKNPLGSPTSLVCCLAAVAFKGILQAVSLGPAATAHPAPHEHIFVSASRGPASSPCPIITCSQAHPCRTTCATMGTSPGVMRMPPPARAHNAGKPRPEPRRLRGTQLAMCG